ncbi:MAG: hypothetical protein M3410_13055 [Acidobacteriota bacterium]|nr:hypothetical protein [Acidobacteriota bacterium]
MTHDSKKQDSRRDPDLEIGSLKTRDEILQVMYWMTGEGLGSEFSVADLRKFLPREQTVLARDLELMVSSGLLELQGEKFALTQQGKAEGGRRFADEFESMIKPGHFECDEPDCDCHSPERAGEACKHLSSAYKN